MRRVTLTIIIVLGVLLVAAGIGFAGFRLGMNYGFAQSPQIAEALQNLPEGAQVNPMMPGGFGPGYGMPYGRYGWGGHWGWGGGFGFLQCLIPLFFLFLLFGLFRLIFRPWGWGWGWHGRRWTGGPGGWDKEGVPPPFEEWHKRAHGQPTDTPPTPPTNS